MELQRGVLLFFILEGEKKCMRIQCKNIQGKGQLCGKKKKKVLCRVYYLCNHWVFGLRSLGKSAPYLGEHFSFPVRKLNFLFKNDTTLIWVAIHLTFAVSVIICNLLV